MNIFFTGGQRSEGKLELSENGARIGRELDNDIVIEGEGASRHHARIFKVGDAWMLEDMGSTNGTKLNGVKVTPNLPAQLKEGDSISIGQQIMVFAKESPLALDKMPAPKHAADTSVQPEGQQQVPLIKITPPDPSDVTVPDAAPVPPKPTETKKDEGAKQFSDFFDQKSSEENAGGNIIATDNLFGKTKQDFGKEEKSDKKKRGGILFYVAVLAVTALLAAAFLLFEQMKDAKYNSETAASTKSKARKTGAPLLVRYEKEIASNDKGSNIFRYVLEIKNGKVTVTRDDLRAHLKDQLSRTVAEEDIKELESALRETDFMGLDQPQKGTPPKEGSSSQRLIIAYGKDMNDVLVYNAPPPPAFLEAVSALENFSDDVLNIPTASLTPDEMREEGLAAFAQAKELLENYQARDENLNEAMKRFNIAIEYLRPFSPTPPEYEEAYKLLQKAEKMLQETVNKHFINMKRYYRLKEYEKAKEEMLAVMGELDPDKKAYKQAKDRVIYLENMIKRQKRRKRK